MKKLGKKANCQRETIEAYMPICRCFCYCDTLETRIEDRQIDSVDNYGF